MEEQQRQFKGIWIPKEIWLNKDLTFQEKIILVEIDSYDDGQVGCFATNKHFVNNFGINSSRISQIIQSLQRKNYININYDFNGNEIIRRYLHINRPPYPEKEGMLKTNIGMLKNEIGVCQFDKGGYVNFLKDNNTNNINNTNNNIYIVEFEEIWKAYPNKKGKENAMKDYIKARKDGVTYETIVNGLKKYLMYCKKEKKWYKPKNGSTWFHQRSWNDEYEIEVTTEDLQMDLTDF
jgi:hypothetical protein